MVLIAKRNMGFAQKHIFGTQNQVRLEPDKT